MYLVLSCVGVLLLLIIYLWVVVDRFPDIDLDQKNVVITGGSSGIGLATAIKCAQQGANVIIVARNVKKLEEATGAVKAAAKKDRVIDWISGDVGEGKSATKCMVDAAARMGGRIDVLITSAGVSLPNHFEKYPLEEFERVTRINYLGTAYCAHGALPFMKGSSPSRIVMVSSLAGLFGLTGFATYTPSKAAVRGLAETLHMELRPYNIQVSLVNPADVDTPMYAMEMENKPEACKIISEGAGVFTPEAIADDILSAIKHWRFMVNTGFDGKLVGVVTAGFGPIDSFADALIQVTCMGVVRLVSFGYLWYWNRVTVKCFKEEQKSQ